MSDTNSIDNLHVSEPADPDGPPPLDQRESASASEESPTEPEGDDSPDTPSATAASLLAAGSPEKSPVDTADVAETASESTALDDEDEWDAAADGYWPEYIGETKRRSKLLAVLMTLVCPGLGYVYLGRFITGMAVNLTYLVAMSAFIVSWTVFKFFPMVPALLFVVGWMVIVGLIIHDLLGRIRSERPYVMRPTNHVVVYVAVLLFTFVIPVYLTLDGSLRFVWQRTWAGNDAMYPTVARGDLVLIDRTAFLRLSPDRGDLVLVEEPASKDRDASVYFARVIGVSNDRVHMEGALPWVNGQEIGQHLHGAVTDLEGHPMPHGGEPPDKMLALIETPLGVEAEGKDVEPERWYMITAPARPAIEPTEPVELKDDEFFVLSDNRTVRFARPGERIGGRVVQREWIVGRPLYVLFSVSPDDGAIRWDRVGLRLR